MLITNWVVVGIRLMQLTNVRPPAKCLMVLIYPVDELVCLGPWHQCGVGIIPFELTVKFGQKGSGILKDLVLG